MLLYLDIISRENMQIEGFFYYLSMGTFQATIIHYLIEKIVGPFIFGRGWCGYACWTTMILDLLPYKIQQNKRMKKFGLLRVVIFMLSLLCFLFIFIYKQKTLKALCILIL